MYKCIISFAGNKVSMKKGDTIECLDKELATDYLRAGFIVEVKEETSLKEKLEKAEEKTKAKLNVTSAEKTPVKKRTKKK